MLTFQQIIQRLSSFWEKRGCVLHQGHDLETGAGTFNPATFLRCLGPEPYKTAYVEPSRRPSDGRYGENPNRVQLFHQFQVIIKPSPANIQDMCLKSFEAIGLKLKEHDIRFVQDDWEGPTLGAWGLGWEVWCDGMEVCQFTYFQAVASLPLKPISVEITYGLERLAMFIQNVESLFDVRWNEKLTLRDISHANEVEWSAYNFKEASTEMWLRHFEDFEKEAKDLIARHLPLPAYDFVIKASHAFNILEARGVISVTERTRYIARIRDLSRLIAIEYLASREKMGFPLLAKEPAQTKTVKAPRVPKISFNPQKKTDFLLEIGSEQLPAFFIPLGCTHLEKALRQFLETQGISYQNIRTFGTPRRLSILVEGIAEGSEPKEIEKKGPAISSAFDAKGHPTPQGEGFLKSIDSSGVSLSKIRGNKVKELEIREIKGQEYLFAILTQKGRSTLSALAEHLPSLILHLDFPKKMRWADLDISYPRPLRWIAALFGNKVIPFQVGNIVSNRFSYGHAQLAPKKFSIKNPSAYLGLLKKQKVLADIEERKSAMIDQLEKLETKTASKALEKEKVLKEVLYLTEYPQLTVASFDSAFLKVPAEVLICEMVEHQRYFPLAKHKLSNQFVITADNTPTDKIRHGNEKVLSARLADGAFLYEQDLKTPLEELNIKLKTMTFQKDLGSVSDKVFRIISHAQILNTHLALADQKKLLRAALLCKADLASLLVREFPELQGSIGKYIALEQNENPDVAEAIAEHWMPKGEEAPLPSTPAGMILSLADKVDNLLGYFSVGLKPSSSSDPYALRRQTLGLIRMLIEGKHFLNLKQVLKECSASFSQANDVTIEEILQFITNRAKTVFENLGLRKEEINAGLQRGCSDPFDAFCKLKALHAFKKSGKHFEQLIEVYKRAKGQLETPSHAPFNPALILEPAEKELVHALNLISLHWKETLATQSYTHAFELLASLQPPLAHLFDTVKILADDPKIRSNRLALLQKVFSYFSDLLDLSAFT